MTEPRESRPDHADAHSVPLLPVLISADAALSVLSAQTQADRQPALVYLASLAPGSRRTMRQALDVLAEYVTGGRATHTTLPWHLLRYQHTAPLQAAVAEQYKPRRRTRCSRP